jgi:hypothetical protein
VLSKPSACRSRTTAPISGANRGPAEPRTVSVPVTSSGTVHGLLSWFAADFGAATVSNEPFSGSHWHQAFHPLAEDIAVTEGDSISILIDDGGSAWVEKRS